MSDISFWKSVAHKIQEQSPESTSPGPIDLEAHPSNGEEEMRARPSGRLHNTRVKAKRSNTKKSVAPVKAKRSIAKKPVAPVQATRSSTRDPVTQTESEITYAQVQELLEKAGTHALRTYCKYPAVCDAAMVDIARAMFKCREEQLPPEQIFREVKTASQVFHQVYLTQERLSSSKT